jgi:hypothetical protein
MPRLRPPRAAFLQALKVLLAKAGVLRPGPGSPYAWKPVSSGYEYTSVLPNWRDRHAFSREAMQGAAPLLYRDEGRHTRPRWLPQDTAHVYIDVSGSMSEALPWLAAAMDPLQRRGLCRLYAFSTIVDPVKKGALADGKVKSTGGTDIRCVCKHMLGFPKNLTPRKVVILTDGMTGTPTKADADALKARRVCVHVGVVEGGTHEDLASFAKSMETLPNFK